MGNLCSIFHSRFKNLIKVIPSARKAQLVDYIILGWQASSFKLKGSDQKWFMKPYSEIVEDTGIPKSTLERYIKELHDEGFIERRKALYSRTTKQGEFEVKKGTYIHITEKLLELIKPSESAIKIPHSTAMDIHNAPIDSYQNTKPNLTDIQPTCIDDDKNEGIDPLILRESYIRDLYPSLLNNIMFKNLTHSVDKPKHQHLNHQFETIQQFLYSEIKEEIPDEVKKLILGTFFNLTFTHQKHFSLPKQVVAEYLFALVNVEFYLPQVQCFKHRNNILSKMIRGNNWKTPKGFYKHFYLGHNFKDQQELRTQRWEQQKERELKPVSFAEIQDPRLIQLEAKMLEKTTLIDALTQNLYEQSREEEILSIRKCIQETKQELEQLWHQQFIIEQDILNDSKLCA